MNAQQDQADQRWLTIATFSDSHDAHLARLRLEGEEIDSLILDEYIVSMHWLYSLAVGGIKLQVRQSDAVRATELLARIRPRISDEPITDGQASCPACGSGMIYRVRFSRRVFFLSLLVLGAPLPFFSRRLRCAACGSEWPGEQISISEDTDRPGDGA